MERIKFLLFLVILSSLIVYLEWGGSNESFLFQAEFEVLNKLFTDPMSVFHPLTLIPLFGQILLLINVFLQKPSKLFSYTGIGSLGVLVLFIFFVGCLALNYKIILSCFPFIALSAYAIMLLRKSE